MAEYVPTIEESLKPWRGADGFRKDFGLKKYKATPGSPPPPVIEDTDARQQDEGDMLRRRRGRAASVLTQQSTLGRPQTAAKTLLGGG